MKKPAKYEGSTADRKADAGKKKGYEGSRADAKADRSAKKPGKRK